MFFDLARAVCFPPAAAPAQAIKPYNGKDKFAAQSIQITVCVLSFLNCEELIFCGSVSKKMKLASDMNLPWKPHFVRAIPLKVFPDATPMYSISIRILRAGLASLGRKLQRLEEARGEIQLKLGPEVYGPGLMRPASCLLGDGLERNRKSVVEAYESSLEAMFKQALLREDSHLALSFLEMIDTETLGGAATKQSLVGRLNSFMCDFFPSLFGGYDGSLDRLQPHLRVARALSNRLYQMRENMENFDMLISRVLERAIKAKDGPRIALLSTLTEDLISKNQIGKVAHEIFRNIIWHGPNELHGDESLAIFISQHFHNEHDERQRDMRANLGYAIEKEKGCERVSFILKCNGGKLPQGADVNNLLLLATRFVDLESAKLVVGVANEPIDQRVVKQCIHDLSGPGKTERTEAMIKYLKTLLDPSSCVVS